MYHAESNTPALARTSNLNEELGQVKLSHVAFIFKKKKIPCGILLRLYSIRSEKRGLP